MAEDKEKITLGEAMLAEDFDSEEAVDNEIGPMLIELQYACRRHNLAFIGAVCYSAKMGVDDEESNYGLLLSTNLPPARVPLEMLGALHELTQ